MSLLKQCLAHGLDPDAPDEEGFGLLHGLAFKYWSNQLSDEGRASYATVLLDHGAKLDTPDSGIGLRPISWACKYGRKALVELFLSRGSPVRMEWEKEEDAPLTQAEQSGFDEIADLLKQENSPESG